MSWRSWSASPYGGASWQSFDVETIQQREGRWVLADLEGKGRRIRTVAIPVWVKQGINAWMMRPT